MTLPTQKDILFALGNPDEALKQMDRADCEESLAAFVKHFWPVIEPGNPLMWGWAMDAICDHLEAVTSGEIKRLIINVPPGFSKSSLTSIFWPAWEWGPRNMANLRYVCVSYAEGLTLRDNDRCRQLIRSDKYREFWPHVVLRKEQDAKKKFENTQTGWKFATSVTGQVMGVRGDRVVLDDPNNTMNPESEAARKETLHFVTEVMPTRVNHIEKSAIVLIQQRTAEEDASGHFLSYDSGYTHLMLPMRFESDRRCSTLIGFSDPRQEEGELLFPERFPLDAVDALERDMSSKGGSYAVAGQMQQRPAPRGGGMFQESWFQYVQAHELPDDRKIVRGWDLAASEGRESDYSVGAKLSMDRAGRVFIEDIVRFRGSSKDVEARQLATARKDGKHVAIDLPQDPGAAGKAWRMAQVRNLHGFVVHASPESGQKATRAMPLAAQAEAGNVYLVKAPWNRVFLDESSVFPAGRHDDQVDACSRAYAALIRKPKKKMPAAPRLVRLAR